MRRQAAIAASRTAPTKVLLNTRVIEISWSFADNADLPHGALAMFVELLSERQQSVLLHYAHEMMLADKRIEAKERLLVESLRAQALPGVEAEDVPVAQLGEVFEDRLTSMALLLELVGVGYADDSFSLSESALISDVAGALRIGQDDLDKVESWVGRQFSLVSEAFKLMEG